jgi:hypothetical protein
MAKPLTTRLNELEYEFEMYLDNGAGSSDTSRFIINPPAIVNLTIEETLADWITRGTLTLFYSFDAIENSSDVKTKTVDGTSVPNYIFRNDGNDILYIRLYPNLKFLKEGNLKEDPVHWELIHKFSIYDVEDIDMPPGAESAASTTIKCKKFYFWDNWYQKMITNTMEYSTAQTAGIVSQAPLDSERSIPTGEAMKDVIIKALKDISNDIPYLSTTLVGGNKNLWENGASKIFYTAPAYNSAFDTLMDLYSRHVSDKYAVATKARTGTFGPRGSGATGNTVNDFSILTKERGPNKGDTGYFALQPMSSYFEKAGKNEPGEYQIERFIIQDVGGTATKPGVKRSPVSNNQDLQKDTKLGQYSQITSYRFVDISPLMNSTEFVNRPVYSFDFRERKYNIEFNNNSVIAARDFVIKKYTNNLLTQSNNDKLFLITLDKNKKTKNIKPIYSLYGGNESSDFINRQCDGLQKLLKIGVFQNSCLFFRTLGSTNRETGRFIAIDKEVSVEENSFNDRFYGQWFIINVKHVIENGVYYNEIAAVKLHRFQALKTSHVETI